MTGDLRDPYFVRHVIDRRFDEVYRLAADMAGAGYIFTGAGDAGHDLRRRRYFRLVDVLKPGWHMVVAALTSQARRYIGD
jgi:hypothetical protein